ncbi:MAG TPA: TIGR00730 family Rossman fold protein, partial [Kiritimatiellia bacterium]|nr:TIGR00730 family Rossman fold protein [Kiritimatiellia bacterium]
MKSVVVYCGSSQSLNPIYRNVALDLGESLARRKLNLVYGGGCTGLMGIVADTVMSHGGTVTGFIPRAMASREVAHYGITCLHIVDNMHQRKAMMLDMADAVIALPGGIGTLEEWAEAITWLSLGYHQKPCGLINYHGFYDPLLAQLQRMSDEGFLRKSWMKNILHADNP